MYDLPESSEIKPSHANLNEYSSEIRRLIETATHLIIGEPQLTATIDANCHRTAQSKPTDGDSDCQFQTGKVPAQWFRTVTDYKPTNTMRNSTLLEIEPVSPMGAEYGFKREQLRNS